MADGRVIIDTELDSSGALKDVPTLSQKFQKGFGAVVGTIGKIGVAAVGAGATAATALSKSAIDSYAEYEQLIGGVETLFKDSAGVVESYANNAYKTAGLSANAYMETVTSFSASLLQGLGGDTEKATNYADRAITDMSDNANKTGTSMEMIQNTYSGFAKQNYTMLDNLKLGYGGTKTEMERLISDASKMTDIQKELGITVEEGSLSFDNIINAISVTQKSMGIMGTTSEEASTTIEGSLNSMKGAWDNLVAGIAKDDADVDSLINQFIESVDTVGQNILPRLGVVFNGMGNLIETLLPKVVEKIPSVVGQTVPNLIKAGYSMVTGIVSGFIQAAPTLIEQGRQLILSLLVFLGAELPEMINELSSIIAGSDGLDTAGITMINQIIQGITTAIPNLLYSLSNLVLSMLTALANALPTMVQMGLNIILGLAKGLLDGIPNLLTMLPDVISAIADGILDSIPLIAEAGVELLTSLVDDLPTIISTLVDTVPEIINNLIDSILEHAPDIAEAGLDLFVSLIKNLPKIISTLNSGAIKILLGIQTTFVKRTGDIAKTGLELFVALIKRLPEIIRTINPTAGKILDVIIQGFKDGIGLIKDVGKNLVEGLWQGITGAGDWLKDKIKGFAKDVVGNFKDMFGIESPSKVMRDQVGRYLAQGIYVGFNMEDPMGQINQDLKYGIKNLDTALTLNGGYYEGINYDKLGDATAQALIRADVRFDVDGRDFARLVGGYA